MYIGRIVGGLLGIAALARSQGLHLGIARVTGRSMEPTLHQGDRLVVLYGAPPRRGGLAVVRLPAADADPRPLAVKRVTGRPPGSQTHWWVERDNPNEGVDSWTLGPIPQSDVKARVLVRLPARHPHRRAAHRTRPGG